VTPDHSFLSGRRFWAFHAVVCLEISDQTALHLNTCYFTLKCDQLYQFFAIFTPKRLECGLIRRSHIEIIINHILDYFTLVFGELTRRKLHMSYVNFKYYKHT